MHLIVQHRTRSEADLFHSSVPSSPKPVALRDRVRLCVPRLVERDKRPDKRSMEATGLFSRLGL